MDLITDHAVLAAFVGNNTWLTVLLVLHIAGAVIGLGPTFAFAILGPMSGKAGPEGGVALMEATVKIEHAMVMPILLTIQPLTGVLLIFNRGLDNDFFSAERGWLLGALAAYIAALIIAIFVQTPAVERLISMAKGGQAGTPEFMSTVKLTQAFGPILTILGIAIVVLMAWKPGGCEPVLRC